MPPPHLHHVIANPAAGGGRGSAALPLVRAVLEAAGATWSLELTAGPGDAARMAASAAERGVGTVIVVGGDGTVSEVANGLLGGRLEAGSRTGHAEASDDVLTGAPAAPSDGADPARHGGESFVVCGALPERRAPTVAIVPVGSGNDFAKPLGLPAGRPTEAARVALGGRERAVDVGRVGDRVFVNGVGLGLDAFVTLETARLERISGAARYVVALVRALRAYRNADVRIDVDGRVEARSITMLSVTNGPCHGGTFWICPHARIDDGRLDICTADAIRPRHVVPLALRAMRGTHVGRPGIAFRTGSRAVVDCDPPLPAHVDGDVLGTAVARMELAVLPGRLVVRVPDG